MKIDVVIGMKIGMMGQGRYRGGDEDGGVGEGGKGGGRG